MSRRFKTPKTTEEDDPNCQTAAITIPYLPDNVIEKILSFLPIKDVVLSTAVSKQWAALWPCFPVIDIDEGDPSNCNCYTIRQRFISFLRNSLRRCRDQRLLDKLRIRVQCDYGYDVWVREWVDFAIKRCVKELDILGLDQRCVKRLITHDVLTLKSLTSLNLENVRIDSSSGTINDAVNLPLLKTMSLKDVTFFDDVEDTDTFGFPILLSGCPCIEHLSIDRCTVGLSTMEVKIVSLSLKFFEILHCDTLNLEISCHSLKSLEIMHCHPSTVSVTCKNLESFTFYSDCTCPDHETIYLWKCDSLKHVDISCTGLKQLELYNCLETMETSFHTSNLVCFDFSGNLKSNVHFLEAPSNLLRAAIRVVETEWPIEYYSAMRDFLESFDCSKKVKLYIDDAECLIIPEQCIMEWSPPLPSIEQLQLYFSAPLGDREYCLRSSLIWMAPYAKIPPFLDKDEDDDDDYDGDDDDDVVVDVHDFYNDFDDDDYNSDYDYHNDDCVYDEDENDDDQGDD